MISEKLEALVKIFKASFWKAAFALLSLIFIALIISLFFLQGGTLSSHAMNNAQRVLLPLQKDGEFIGTKISVELKETLKPETDELAVAPIPPTAPTEPAPQEELATEGEAADLSGTTPEAMPEDSAQTSATEMVVGEAMSKTRGDDTTLTSQPPVTVEKRSPGRPLAKAPDAQLTEKIGEFNLPKISEDGVKPWEHYGKPFDDTGKPLIAIIVQGLGLGRITTENALNLDSHVTLSFSPYAKNTNMWASHARNIGHEVLLDLPQETTRYPAEDPGPYALLNSLDEDGNRERIHWVMARTAGYVGLMQTDNPAPQTMDVMNAFKELSNRGLVYIEAPHEKQEGVEKHQKQMGMITQSYNIRIDDVLNKASIQEQLNQLVKIAKKDGVAIGVTRPYPLSLEQINLWTAELDKMGVTLAPVSAVVDHEN